MGPSGLCKPKSYTLQEPFFGIQPLLPSAPAPSPPAAPHPHWRALASREGALDASWPLLSYRVFP